MIATTLSLMLASSAPTLAEVNRLPPAAAGDLVLQGKDHAPIEEVTTPPPQPLTPPGWSELHLVERPVLIGRACSRTRWVATFARDFNAPESSSALRNTYGRPELGLAPSGQCSGTYVHLNLGIAPGKAVTALEQLEQIRTGQRKVHFACSDSTSSDLCRDDATIRRGLARLTPLVVSPHGKAVVFWLDSMTSVGFLPEDLDEVVVTRAVPPPA
jgi:hypothetical protein